MAAYPRFSILYWDILSPFWAMRIYPPPGLIDRIEVWRLVLFLELENG